MNQFCQACGWRRRCCKPRGTKIRGQHATAHELEFEAAFALQPLPDRAPHEAASAVASHNIFRADADLPATGGLRAQFDVIALLGQLKHAVPVTNVDGWELARTVEQQRFENQLARAKCGSGVGQRVCGSSVSSIDSRGAGSETRCSS